MMLGSFTVIRICVGTRLFPRTDKKEEKSKPGYVRIIIKNQEISIRDPNDPLFEMPRERKFKQVNL